MGRYRASARKGFPGVASGQPHQKDGVAGGGPHLPAAGTWRITHGMESV